MFRFFNCLVSVLTGIVALRYKYVAFAEGLYEHRVT